MNNLTIAGHLGADPEVRFTSNGKKVTTMRVAVRTRVKNADDTIWYRVTLWGDQFDKMIPHFKKGSSIIACGELHKPEIFKDRDGNPQISLDITANSIMFSPFGRPERSGSENASMTHSESSAPAPAQAGKGPVSNHDIADDEIPF